MVDARQVMAMLEHSVKLFRALQQMHAQLPLGPTKTKDNAHVDARITFF
jgi:hypothetical protein